MVPRLEAGVEDVELVDLQQLQQFFPLLGREVAYAQNVSALDLGGGVNRE